MIAIYTQILQREYGIQLDGKASEYMRFVAQGAKRLEDLLKDLLTYVRIANSNTKGVEWTDANEVLRGVLSDLRPPIEEAAAEIETGLLPVLMITPVHLVQLFQNLVGNALKYRGTSAPRISISAVRNDGEWRFDVRDNGIGVDPQFAQHIFGVFKRLHGADGQYGGNGIGLAICQKIVHRYGGRIWVESEGAGRGSLFSFTLPASGDTAMWRSTQDSAGRGQSW